MKVEDCNQMTYTTAKLRDVCSLISSGGTPSRKQSEYFCVPEEGHLWVKSKELLDGSISMTEENITDDAIENSSAKYYPANTILLAMYGANVGQLGWLKQRATVNQAICGMVVDENIAHWRYIFYAIMVERRELVAKAFGAAQQNLNQEIIQTFEIPFPSLPTQRKIASVLSAYDDLIENNTRRIKILEEMAQRIYREWFVDFSIPSRENVKMVDSELGMIPEGWKVKRLGDAFLIVLGGTPSRNRPEFWRNGTVPWINSGKVNDLRVTEPSELITDFALRRSAAKLMPPGTTLIAITGATLGQVSILEIEASANQSVVGIISEDENLIEWLHLTIRERISSIINHASGGAQQHINKGIVDDVVVAVPPGDIAEKFRNIAHPLYRQIAGLIFKNTTLRCTRDLLLPKLISGEVDVLELDITVPDITL